MHTYIQCVERYLRTQRRAAKSDPRLINRGECRKQALIVLFDRGLLCQDQSHDRLIPPVVLVLHTAQTRISVATTVQRLRKKQRNVMGEWNVTF
ncbi:unnamed protein product [Caenorhabditis auriculariae]|uniref:Uncharacterized protein n=1 Tax=Caenorhabditis auriculariae TaxID=2777116 RepID=A0A8S1H219_9PELO|nr:unnamed protein product [Caenorhabditis auriculariae]